MTTNARANRRLAQVRLKKKARLLQNGQKSLKAQNVELRVEVKSEKTALERKAIILEGRIEELEAVKKFYELKFGKYEDFIGAAQEVEIEEQMHNGNDAEGEVKEYMNDDAEDLDDHNFVGQDFDEHAFDQGFEQGSSESDDSTPEANIGKRLRRAFRD
ncbi:hypothetical protein N0V90_006042 [Kalmusia sp. IMI 367209]|nr:hypothetical protein N0V90_006042 [Kalmusia sp. IMI 367209]